MKWYDNKPVDVMADIIFESHGRRIRSSFDKKLEIYLLRTYDNDNHSRDVSRGVICWSVLDRFRNVR